MANKFKILDCEALRLRPRDDDEASWIGNGRPRWADTKLFRRCTDKDENAAAVLNKQSATKETRIQVRLRRSSFMVNEFFVCGEDNPIGAICVSFANPWILTFEKNKSYRHFLYCNRCKDSPPTTVRTVRTSGKGGVKKAGRCDRGLMGRQFR